MEQSAPVAGREMYARLGPIPILLGLLCPLLLAQRDRIPEAVDQNRRLIVQGNVHSKAQPKYDQGRVEPSLKLDYVTMALKKSAAQQADLSQLLIQQQDPASPLFHKWLTPEQYADRYGLSQNDISKVSDWLEASGCTVLQVARGRDSIAFRGTAQQIEDMLKTTIHYYLVDGEKHYANATEPSIPQAFADVVAGFLGLNDFRPEPPRRLKGPARKAPGGSVHPDFLVQGGVNILAPDDLATIYDVAPLYQNGIDGTGLSLVVAGQTNIDLGDIRAFRQFFNLPQNDPQLVLVQGDTDPGIVPKELGEADLDLEWSGAIARNATIIFVYSHSALASAAYAIDNALAPVISYSFSNGCEHQVTQAFAQIVESAAKKANSEGITWIVSSGDAGSAACEDQNGMATKATTGKWVNIPASLPEVTGVGGTEFAEGGGNYFSSTPGPNGGTALSYIPEIAWNDSSLLSTGFASGGGGASTFFAKPSWQSGPGVPKDGERDVPDIALTASSAHDPYLIATAGQYIAIGGTSAATPTFAGIVVLLNHYLTSAGTQPGLGNINPTLYSMAQSVPSAFHDITVGNNIVSCQSGSPDCVNGSFGYTAGPGYDQVTGLGSIDAYKLITNWSPASSTKLPLLAVTALSSDTSVAIGGKINVSVTIANLGQADAGPFRVGEYLTSSQTPPPIQSYFAYCDFQSLAAGASATCSGSLNVPANLQPQQYYLIALADIFNQVVQSDQSQNARLSDSGPVTIRGTACTYSLSSTGAQVPASGGNGSFTVTTQNGCSWSASSNVNWITITSGGAGNGSGTVFYNVGANSGLARTGTISAANQQFSISQAAFVNVNVTLQFTNSLIYPANISVNGTGIGSVNASSSTAITIPAPTTLLVSFEMVRPTLGGVPLGDPMIGYYNAINSPTGTYSFTINNQIGSQYYFVPLVTNTSAAPLLMDVNGGLQAENRCNCVVPAFAVNVQFGYYQLFSNSNVRAFRDGSGYTGAYYYFDSFSSQVEGQTGILRLTFNQSP